MEVAPRVHSIPVDTWTFMGLFAPNIYLVLGEKPTLIDSGYDDGGTVGKRLEYIEKLAPQKLEYILITHPHPDHIGGCRSIQKSTGAKVVLHSSGMARARNKYRIIPDVLVEDGDILDIGGLSLEMIHTPGHSPASVCIYIRESKTLFTGDHILGIGTTMVDFPEGDMTQYIDSLKKLLNYDIRLICPGHGPLIKEGERKIRELIAHRMERELQVLRCLRQRRKNVARLVAEIYPELDCRLLELARRQVLAHLRKLVRERKVISSGGVYALR